MYVELIQLGQILSWVWASVYHRLQIPLFVGCYYLVLRVRSGLLCTGPPQRGSLSLHALNSPSAEDRGCWLLGSRLVAILA